MPILILVVAIIIIVVVAKRNGQKSKFEKYEFVHGYAKEISDSLIQGILRCDRNDYTAEIKTRVSITVHSGSMGRYYFESMYHLKPLSSSERDSMAKLVASLAINNVKEYLKNNPIDINPTFSVERQYDPSPGEWEIRYSAKNRAYIKSKSW